MCHYNSLTQKDYISPELLNKGYTKEQINALMKHKNQGEEFIISGGLKIYGDLKGIKYPYFGFILSAFQQYQKGVLPFPGSYSEQPAQIIEIFELLEQLKFEQQERARIEAEKESRKLRKDG